MKEVHYQIDTSISSAEIYTELLREYEAKLLTLSKVTEIEKNNLFNLLNKIGACISVRDMKNKILSECSNPLDEITPHPQLDNLFKEIKNLSKIPLSLIQIEKLSLLGMLEFYSSLIIRDDLPSLSDIEQYEFYKELIKYLMDINYILGTTISEIAETSKRAKGGKTKAENYNKKMKPIYDEAFRLFKSNNPETNYKWKSKSECAKYFIKKYYREYPHTDIILDHKKIVTEITNRINNNLSY